MDYADNRHHWISDKCAERGYEMTRKEAIKVLETSNEYHHMIGDLPHSTKSKEAFKMAIEALEQEPCDKCEVGNPCLYCKHEFEPRESEG